jgi:hypothetical protein
MSHLSIFMQIFGLFAAESDAIIRDPGASLAVLPDWMKLCHFGEKINPKLLK